MRLKQPISASVALATLLLGLAAGQADAQVVLDRNATIDYRIDQGIHVVDGPSPPTRVTIAAPADIEEDLLVFGSSVVDVLGGRIDEYLEARDASTVNIRGGTVEDDVIARDTSFVEITGGLLLDYVIATGASVVNVRGGSVWGVEARGDAVVSLSGGTLRAWPQEVGLLAGESGTIIVRGTGFNYPYGT